MRFTRIDLDRLTPGDDPGELLLLRLPLELSPLVLRFDLRIPNPNLGRRLVLADSMLVVTDGCLPEMKSQARENADSVGWLVRGVPNSMTALRPALHA